MLFPCLGGSVCRLHAPGALLKYLMLHALGDPQWVASSLAPYLFRPWVHSWAWETQRWIKGGPCLGGFLVWKGSRERKQLVTLMHELPGAPATN